MIFSLFMFVSSVTITVTVSSEAGIQFKIVKCCPEGKWLDSSLRECRELPHSAESVNDSSQSTPPHWLPPAGRPWLPPDLAALGAGGEGRASMPNCSAQRTLRLATHSARRYQWLRNGSLALHSPTARDSTVTTTFSPDEFCVDNAEGLSEAHAILLCPCNKVKCVNKCCSAGYIKKCAKFKCSCERSEAIWKPFHSDNELPPGIDVTYEVLEANQPNCSAGKSLWIDNPSFKPHHYTRYWWEYPKGYLFNDLDICGDFAIFDELPMYQTIGYCYVSFLFDDMFNIGALFRIIPASLLAMTLIVLILVPERRLSVRGWIHSKCLLCHAATLLLCNGVIMSYVIFNNDGAYCRTTPFVMYFSLVAAAFWLNTICINMAWGFGRPKGPYGDKPGAGRRVFLYYSVYAWGSSLLMTAVALTMWYSREVPRGWLRPTLMETRSCFWEDKKGAGKMGTLAYFYGPVGTLLVVNASLFVFISVKVKRLRRKTSILNRDTDSQRRLQNHRQALLYVRIVWLMGVAEMTVEMAAWALHGDGYYFLLAAEFIDFLRVVSIFVLCVCKWRTMRALRDRLCACRLAENVRVSWSSWRQQRTPQDELELPPSAGNDARAEKKRSVRATNETVSTTCEVAQTTAQGDTLFIQ